jgi:hypothetical protein
LDASGEDDLPTALTKKRKKKEKRKKKKTAATPPPVDKSQLEIGTVADLGR